MTDASLLAAVLARDRERLVSWHLCCRHGGHVPGHPRSLAFAGRENFADKLNPIR